MLPFKKTHPVIAGRVSCNEDIKIFRIPTPDGDRSHYKMIAGYSLDELMFKDFEYIVIRLRYEEDIETLKNMRQYVTHLKRAYLEYVLTEIAIERIKNAAEGKDKKRNHKKPYHRTGRRSL